MFTDDYIRWAKTITDAPEEFLAAGALSCLSAAVGRNVCLNNRIYPNLWLVLIGESSIARKSTAVGLAKILCERAGIPTFPDRITPESFYENLVSNPQGLFALGELGGWLGSLSRNYATGLKQDMAELYDCPPDFRRIRKDTKGRVKEFKIKRPYITVISASTSEWFEENISENDAGGGFLPRFNYVIGVERKPYPIPPELIVPDDLINTLKSISKCSGNITLNKASEGYDIYVDWFNDFRNTLKSSPKALIPFGVRLETVALKIAILSEAENNPGDVLSHLDKHSITTGCNSSKEFFRNACSVIEKLSYSSFERLCQKVYDFIARKPGCTQRDVLRAICVPKGAFQDAMGYLTEAGKIRTETPKGSRGRPTTHLYPDA